MKYLSILIIASIVACNLSKLPDDKLDQYQLDTSYKFNGDELQVYLNNSLKCPMRIWVQAKDPQLKAIFDENNPITLSPLTDTIIRLEIHTKVIQEISFASRFGDLKEKVTVNKLALPFQTGKKYRLIQGYNSKPTHHTDWSRYALDFGLAEGDTVCSATSGFIVGLIEDYKYGGEKGIWTDYANCITVYDPATGLYTQYVHLDYKGSLVNIGDQIKVGQKIGISGKTGYTNIAHLHFNCLKPVHSNHGLISVALDSIGQYKVSELKRNDYILHNN